MTRAGEGTRLSVWLKHLGNLDVMAIVFGQGQTADRWKAGGGQPHSGYLDLICYYGMWGVIWFLVVMVGFVRRIRLALRSTGQPYIRAFGTAATLFLVVLAWFSLTADSFGPGGFSFLMFAVFLALSDRAMQLLQQQQIMEYEMNANEPDDEVFLSY